jgi:hypothetical protein
MFGVLSLVVVICGCWGEHQIGASRAAYKAVDALYTAVGLRDPKLLGRCEEKLRGLREADELPVEAAESLNSIIAEARSGSWEPAQERLSRFMEGQRR